MSFLACPEGYCSFEHIPATIVVHREWKLQLLPVKIELIEEFLDRGVLPFSADHDRFIDPTYPIMLYMAQKLGNGEYKASAILGDGSIVWVPPAAWRLMDWIDDRQFSAVERAFAGYGIYIPRSNGTFDMCRPVISFHDLAGVFGAKNRPPPPRVPPVHLSEYAPPKDTNAEAAAQQAASTARPSGGRPAGHDWDAFWIEVAHYAARNDLETAHRLDLQSHMQEWAEQQPGTLMDDSTIRRKLSKLYARNRAKVS